MKNLKQELKETQDELDLCNENLKALKNNKCLMLQEKRSLQEKIAKEVIYNKYEICDWCKKETYCTQVVDFYFQCKSCKSKEPKEK